MHILENPSEKRLRAPFRLSFFLLGMIVIWIIAGIIQGFISNIGPNWVLTSVSFIITALLSTGLVYLSGKWVDYRSFAAFGFQKSRLWMRELIDGVIITTVVVLFIYVFGINFGYYETTGFRPGTINALKWITSQVGYFIMMASVAYYEELLFRGYLTLNLFEGFQKNRLKSRAAALTTTLVISVFFAIVHANNPNASWLGVTNILLAGFMLGIPYFITGSLAMPIGIHFAWNYIQGPILGLSVSGIVFPTSIVQSNSMDPHFLSGGTFGLEGGLLGTSGILLIIIFSLILLRKRYVLTRVHPLISSQPILRQQ